MEQSLGAHKPEPTTCPIKRVFEVDDLLGKIYSSIRSAADRQAFRHCTSSTYRSPSINCQISRLVLRPETPESTLQETAAKVGAFPQHATIKAVALSAQDSLSFCAMLCALQASPARPRLQSAEHATLTKCHLYVDCASMMSDLLPSLRKLVMLLGTCDDSSMGILAALLPQLEELVLDNVNLEGQDFADHIAAFRNLKSFDMSSSSRSVLPTVRPLAAAVGLKSLRLQGYGIMAEGLEVVLAEAPLELLSIEAVLFPSPAPRLRSATLKRLHLFMNASYPELQPQEFPNLEVLSVAGVEMFGERFRSAHLLGPHLLSDEGQLLGLGQVVMGLASGFPVEPAILENAPNFYESKSEGPRKMLMIVCESGTRPATTYLALLKLLSSCPALLNSVERLGVGYFKMCTEGLRLTSRLFPSAEHVFLSGGYLGDKISDVLMMPRLQQLCLMVQEPPRDVISTLTLAMLAGKSLVLDVMCDEHWEFMQALKHQWDDMQAAVPAARRVLLRASSSEAD